MQVGLAKLPSGTKVSLMKTELVTTLKRRATKIISTLVEDRDPILITQRGRPAAYLIDVETYEGLKDKLAVLEVIGRGERAIQEGRVISHKQAKKRLARWLR
jgi:prevent-host-death family protein